MAQFYCGFRIYKTFQIENSLWFKLKLNNVAEDFENMDSKPFVFLEGLYMTRGELTNIPQNIEYIARTICYLSFAYNHIATLDGMFNITFEKLLSI